VGGGGGGKRKVSSIKNGAARKISSLRSYAEGANSCTTPEERKMYSPRREQRGAAGLERPSRGVPAIKGGPTSLRQKKFSRVREEKVLL